MDTDFKLDTDPGIDFSAVGSLPTITQQREGIMRNEREFIEKYLSKEAPEGSDLKTGQTVTMTNPQGVVFRDQTIIGFSDGKAHLAGESSPYWYGYDLKQLRPQTPQRTPSKSKAPGM